jgi:hypothetical protein
LEAERISGEWFDAQVEKYRQMWRERTGENPRARAGAETEVGNDHMNKKHAKRVRRFGNAL